MASSVGIDRRPPVHRIVLVAVCIVAGASAPARAQVGEYLGEGIARFHRDVESAQRPHHSFALVGEVSGRGGVPDGFRVRPVFSTRADGRRVVHIDIEPGTSLYGTGEIAGPLLRNGRVSETWNTDAYGYREDNASLYQSHPWVLAVRENGSAFGVLADTTWRCEMDLRHGVTFAADGPDYPVIVIDRDSPQEVIKGLATLTGTLTMPPLWAIGYNQCRYSYNPDSRVMEVARGFREHDIPCDVIWMDIDYMDAYRVFTFDKEQFPDPAGLNDSLHGLGFHSVWMIDPGVKREIGYPVYESGSDGDHWVQRPDGSVYTGDVWPGACVFPDFTRPETRDWWAALYRDFIPLGVDGVWNDMNEPAIFNVESKTMPEDNLHRGGGELSPGPHAQYHNVYGMLMVKATRDGVMASRPEKRPFVLTRANFIGGHRYAATWTGDNAAEWYDLENSIPMVLNLGLSGQPFCGPDIGGFIGNGTPELFARWIGIGSLLPFSRGHTGKGNINKEPWAFNDEVTATSRRALQRRYRLLPYLYTLFHEASVTGLPVARPVFFADPKDPALRSEDDAFLLGADLLVVCATTPLGDRVPALPRGTWRQIDLVGGAGDADLPSLRLRAGSILPVGPVENFADEKPLDPLTLMVSLDERGAASGILYEDAGDGWGYQSGEFLLTRYGATTSEGAVRVRIASSEGDMPRPSRKVVVQVLLDDGGIAAAEGSDGEEIVVKLGDR